MRDNTGYTANGLNQYTSIDPPATAAVTPAYDGRGNLTGNGANSYGYDALNRMISSDVAGLAVSYSYDPLGLDEAEPLIIVYGLALSPLTVAGDILTNISVGFQSREPEEIVGETIVVTAGCSRSGSGGLPRCLDNRGGNENETGRFASSPTAGGFIIEHQRLCRTCHGVETSPDDRYLTEEEIQRLVDATNIALSVVPGVGLSRAVLGRSSRLFGHRAFTPNGRPGTFNAGRSRVGWSEPYRSRYHFSFRRGNRHFDVPGTGRRPE